MTHIFISYSHTDSDFVNALKGELNKVGLSAWMDAEQLRAGEDWRQAIDEAIHTSFVVITVMTPKAKASEYVTYEWAYGWGAGIKVIPILLQPTELHPRLEALQYLDFTNPQQRPWVKLIERLTDLKAVYQPPSKRVLDSGIEKLVSDLQNPDSEKRCNAAKALGNLKDTSVIPDLVYMLANDGSWGARRYAANALGSIGSPEALAWLIRALHSDQSNRVRQSVGWAIGEIGSNVTTKKHLYGQGIIPSLREAAFNDRDTRVRSICIEALGKLCEEDAYRQEATDALIDLLYRGYPIREEIMEALSQSEAPEAIKVVSLWQTTKNLTSITNLLSKMYRRKQNQQ